MAGVFTGYLFSLRFNSRHINTALLSCLLFIKSKSRQNQQVCRCEYHEAGEQQYQLSLLLNILQNIL